MSQVTDLHFVGTRNPTLPPAIGCTASRLPTWVGAFPALLLTFATLPGPLSADSRVQGDFNGDGFADLVVGVPGEGVGNQPRAGAVNIIYGPNLGGDVDSEIWTQGAAGVDSLQTLGDAENGDHFGAAVAVGDFDGDGYSDLAIGVPYEDIGNLVNAGAVEIIYGGVSGLSIAGAQIWTLRAPGVDSLQLPFDAGRNTYFGEVLIAGDFNGDGRDDLAIGVPSDNLSRGAVYVMHGAQGGLGGNPQRWAQGENGILGAPDILDQFGAALAAGDFNGDGRDDLAIGVPRDFVASRIEAGAVNVIYGGSAGLWPIGNQRWTQNSPGIMGVAEPGDGFGSCLAAGNFDGSFAFEGTDDLAIGVPYESVAGRPSAGAVNVLYGRLAAGLGANANQIWTQRATGVDSLQTEGVAEAGDWFGFALVAGDFDASGADDLAVGVPGESVGNTPRAGAVNLIFGATGAGLNATTTQIWTQSAAGVDSLQTGGVAEAGDGFGSSLSAGDFADWGGQDQLLVGVPFESVGNWIRAGAVVAVDLFPDAPFGPPPYEHQVWTQGAAGVGSFQTEGVAEPNDGFGFLTGSSALRPW
jgi:hypothetical protein